MNDFFKAAEAREREGHTKEAIRIYRELSESMSANFDTMQEHVKNWKNVFEKTVNVMASCIIAQEYEHTEMRQHISYLYRRFISEEHGHMIEAFGRALERVCIRVSDVRYWQSLYEPNLPDAVSDNHFQYNIPVLMVLMQAHILEKIGDSPALEDLFKKYRNNNFSVCYAHVEFVHRTDPDRSLEVAKQAVRLFPNAHRGIMHIVSQ